MPIPLTLGVRPGDRDPGALLANLLWPQGTCRPHAIVGPAVQVLDTTADPGAVPADATAVLDLAAGRGAVTVDSASIRDATTALLGARESIPARRVVVFGSSATVAELADAGYLPGLDATPTDPDNRADFLAAMAHLPGGFVARAATSDDVLTVLAATVAALRGDYVRDALARPDFHALRRLHPDAVAATREVLVGVVVPAGVDAAAMATELDRALVNKA